MALFRVDRRYPMFLFCSHGVKPTFQAALDPDQGKFRVLCGQGRQWRDPRWLYCRDDAQRYSLGVGKLSSDEARRIGKAIARIPEFLMPRQGFYPRGGGPRWRADRPYYVVLEDQYIREHWDEISALCRLNSLPFNSTGEVIQSDGVWRVYEFTWQMDANPVLGPLQGPLAAWHGVSLSGAAREFAIAEAD
jgi:hypothetical protein